MPKEKGQTTIYKTYT